MADSTINPNATTNPQAPLNQPDTWEYHGLNFPITSYANIKFKEEQESITGWINKTIHKVSKIASVSFIFLAELAITIPIKLTVVNMFILIHNFLVDPNLMIEEEIVEDVVEQKEEVLKPSKLQNITQKTKNTFKNISSISSQIFKISRPGIKYTSYALGVLSLLYVPYKIYTNPTSNHILKSSVQLSKDLAKSGKYFSLFICYLDLKYLWESISSL